MRKIQLLLSILLSITIQTSAITIMKNVGHGDCYIIISDGRIVLIDLGPSSSPNNIVSILKSGYLSFDRIAITHIHADHVGGIISAHEYANTTNSVLKVDKIVSNHGQHDLNLITSETNIKKILNTFTKKNQVVGLDDEAIKNLEMTDDNMEFKMFKLETTGNTENKKCMIFKVTEIRDGQRKATLFLGDIEKSQQDALFNRKDKIDLFKDVQAVTLPHHGRISTLSKSFLKELRKEFAGNVYLLHSDKTPLNNSILQEAKNEGFEIISTANSVSNKNVNLFSEKTYYETGLQKTSLLSIVQNEMKEIVKTNNYEEAEVLEAVSKYCNRPSETNLAAGTVISIPSSNWINNYIKEQRSNFSKQTDELIIGLNSLDKKTVHECEIALAKRLDKLSDEQLTRIKNTSERELEKLEIINSGPAALKFYNGITENNWVVTYNPGLGREKLFVHENSNGGSLNNLMYLVEEGSDETWKVYVPNYTNNGNSYGKLICKMKKPKNIRISRCSCR